MAFVGLAHASIPDPLGVVHTCVNRNSGEWKVIDSALASCKANEQALDLNQKGPKGDKGDKGEPGTFNGTLSSPNGQFTLSVTNSGIVLTGPTGNITVGPSSITVNSSTIVDINGVASATLRGGTTHLGCAGGLPVVRAGADIVSVDPDSGIGAAIIGSTTVSAC